MALPLPQALNLPGTYYKPLTTTPDMASHERPQRGPAPKSAPPKHPATETSFIDDEHGRHGGGEESEGRPQTRDDEADQDKPGQRNETTPFHK